MDREIRIYLVEPDKWIPLGEDSPPPDGVKVSGPMCVSLASDDAPSVLPYITVTLSFLGMLGAEVAKELAKDAMQDQANHAKKWLVELLSKRKAARPRINGREPKDRAELDSLVSELIEVGKND